MPFHACARAARPRAPCVVESLERRYVLSAAPPLGTTIEGPNFDLPAQFPPDANAAVGPSHVVEVINSNIEWVAKTGGPVSNQTLQNLFSTTAPIQQPGVVPFDPRVLYDQYSGRFVVTALAGKESTASPGSAILIAASNSADPNAGWTTGFIPTGLMINGSQTWADFDGLGLDQQAIYITANMLGTINEAFFGTRLWIVNKSVLYSSGTVQANVFDPASLTGTAGRTLQPAHMYGAEPAGAGTFLAQYSGFVNNGTAYVNVIRVDNPLGNPSFVQHLVPAGVIDNVGAIFPDAPQPGTSTGIETNGDEGREALNAVWRNNSLYFASQLIPLGGPDAGHVTAHWFNVNTSTFTMNDQGNVSGGAISPGAFTYYPTVAVDAQGDLGISFAASSSTLFASAYYTGRLASDPPGTVDAPAPLATGEDFYVRNAPTDSRNRWGDYGGIAIDPTDDATFWAFNQYALTRGSVITGFNGDGRWGTRAGSFRLQPGLPLGSIAGQVFNDLNGNGAKDPGEPGLGGFVLYLDTNNNGVLNAGETTATTAADGTFLFNNVPVGTYTLRQLPLSGFPQTAPAGGSYSVQVLAGQTSGPWLFGDHPPPGTISGRAFLDLNGNGVFDPGESGLAGKTVYLDSNENGQLDTGEPTAVTDASGNYSFTNLAPGMYTVREFIPSTSTFKLTSGPSYTFFLSGGQVAANLDFGNTLYGYISGLNFNDLNGNGVRDPGEPGLPNWSVYLDMNNDQKIDSNTDSRTATDVPKPIPDNGTVLSTQVVGALASPIGLITGLTVTLSINHPFDSDLHMFLTSPAGTRVELFDRVGGAGQNFTNTTLDDRAATPISAGAAPFMGTYQPSGHLSDFYGESPTGEWTLEVNDEAAGNVGTLTAWSLSIQHGDPVAQTNASGIYLFPNLPPNNYLIREVAQPGFGFTSPPSGSRMVTLTSGQGLGNTDFGVAMFGSITGSVFNDANNNAARDAGEVGLAGWTVYIDANNNGVLDPGEIRTTTDAAGNYSLSGLLPGTFVVRQVVQPGYRRTTPLTPFGDIQLVSGQTAAGPVFGDVLTSTVILNFNYLVIFARHYNQAGTIATGDLNDDGIVNFTDFTILARHYNHTI